MESIQGTARIVSSPLVGERNAGANKQNAEAFEQAMNNNGEQAKPEPDAANAALRRALQRRARISRNEAGEAMHVDVIA